MSIFEEIDNQTNPSSTFWYPPESFALDDITHNKILASELKLLKNKNFFKARNFILTSSALYSCKKLTNNPKKMTIVKWKKVEAFTEESATEQRFGFKLGHRNKFIDFYAENVDVLEEWLVALSKVAIMIDIEEDFITDKEIGKGNYATVYLSRDLENNERYAVKQINKEVVYKSSRGPSAVISEIEIMRKINHPMIVKLFRVYENENYVSLVLDYVEAGSLYTRIQKLEKFSEEDSAKFIKNLLEVLYYLHSMNIVHRDLKPENILMVSNANNFEFKLCDFGLACIAGDDQVLRCGSPGYVAPEILLKKAYNNKVDIFSAGIILFIILSGRAPFYGKNSNEILIKNRECKLLFHEKYWGHISRECVDLVVKLTDPDPDERHSAEVALRHPWLSGSFCMMNLLKPGSLGNNDKSPDSGGSYAFFKTANDRRELGAEVVFGNLEYANK